EICHFTLLAWPFAPARVRDHRRRRRPLRPHLRDLRRPGCAAEPARLVEHTLLRPQALEAGMSRLSKEVVAAGLREATRIRAGFVPGDDELAGAPLISHWVVEPVSGNLVRLFGEVSEHPLLPDGWRRTSAVLAA